MKLATKRRALAAACAALVATGLSVGAPVAVAGAPRSVRTGTLPPDHPSASIPANPAYESTCTHPAFDESSSCRTATLQAIANARALEGLGPMVLPYNWTSLSKGEQLFTAINIERVDRGVKPMTGMVSELTSQALLGAQGLLDPSMPAGYHYTGAGSIAAGGQSSVLGAMYEWMYFDGVGSHNPECDEQHPSKCWVHRDIILRAWSTNPGTVGAAATMTTYDFGNVPQAISAYAALVVGDSYNTSHTYTFTWAHELPYFSATPGPMAAPTISVPASRQAKGTWASPYYLGTPSLTGYRLTWTVDGVAATPTEVAAATRSDVIAVPNGRAVRLSVAGSNTAGLGPAASSDVAVAPFPSLSAFVARQYQDVVGRAPTAAELAAGLTAIRGGQSPSALVASLRAGTDATTNVDPATRLYFAYFLRVPDPGGLGHWIGKRRTGTTLNRISDAFAASSEFQRRYGSLSNRAFVELVYQNVLGRPGDASGISYWTAQLDQRKKSRGQVMVGFSESSEYKRKSKASVDVAVAHIQLLGAAPDAATFAAEVAQLGDATLTVTTLVRNLFDDDRYAARVT